MKRKPLKFSRNAKLDIVARGLVFECGEYAREDGTVTERTWQLVATQHIVVHRPLSAEPRYTAMQANGDRRNMNRTPVAECKTAHKACHVLVSALQS